MHDIKWTYPKSDYRPPRPKQCCEFDIHKCCGRTRKTKITRELSFVPCEEIADVLFEDQMLRVLCSPTPAAFRDSRAFNWRMLHVDVLGRNNDREFGRVALLLSRQRRRSEPMLCQNALSVDRYNKDGELVGL